VITNSQSAQVLIMGRCFLTRVRARSYAATSLFCRAKASNSALIASLWVEHIPCGAPAMTFSVAPLTSFAESSAESAMGTT
jgi:hypothetical protein